MLAMCGISTGPNSGGSANAVTTNGFAVNGIWDSTANLIGFQKIKSVTNYIVYTSSLAYFKTNGVLGAGTDGYGSVFTSKVFGSDIVLTNPITHKVFASIFESDHHYFYVGSPPYETLAGRPDYYNTDVLPVPDSGSPTNWTALNGLAFASFTGADPAPTITFGTNSITPFTNFYTILPYRTPEVYCFTNGPCFVLDGVTYYPTNSTTCGLQEANNAVNDYCDKWGSFQPHGKIKLGYGVFPLTTPLLLTNISIEGLGMTLSGITYFGANPGVGGPLIYMENNNQMSEVKNLFMMGATNCVAKLLSLRFVTGRTTLSQVWFSQWPLATNGCNGFNPDDCAGSTAVSNNLVVSITGNGSDVSSVQYCQFTHIGSLEFFADHGEVVKNMFEGCGIMSLTGTNQWDKSYTYNTGAQIIIPPISGNGVISIRGNYYVGGILAHAVFGTGDARNYLFEDEDVSERITGSKIDLIATSTGIVTVNERNPKYNSYQGSLQMTNGINNYPTFAAITNTAYLTGVSNGTVRIVDERAFPAPTFQVGTTNVTLAGATTLVVSFPTPMISTNYYPTIQPIGATVVAYYPSLLTTTNFTANFTALTFTGKMLWKLESLTQ